MDGFITFENETKAISLCEQRASLIARNLANSNTPNFKAQDINFSEAMQQAKETSFSLQQTNPNHLGGINMSGSGTLYYRVPMQTRMDENTVDNEIERKNFIENSLKYQSSLSFIERKGAQYLKAIKGE